MQESGKGLGMGEKEGIRIVDGSSCPPFTQIIRDGGAALHTSRKMRDSRLCQLPGKRMHLAQQKQHSGKDRKVTAAAQHG